MCGRWQPFQDCTEWPAAGSNGLNTGKHSYIDKYFIMYAVAVLYQTKHFQLF